jgi:hypothetical protein
MVHTVCTVAPQSLRLSCRIQAVHAQRLVRGIYTTSGRRNVGVDGNVIHVMRAVAALLAFAAVVGLAGCTGGAKNRPTQAASHEPSMSSQTHESSAPMDLHRVIVLVRNPYRALGITPQEGHAVDIRLRAPRPTTRVRYGYRAALAILRADFPSNEPTVVSSHVLVLLTSRSNGVSHFRPAWTFVIPAVVEGTFRGIPGRHLTYTVIFIDALNADDDGGFTA